MDVDVRNPDKRRKFAAWLSIGVFGGLATGLVTITLPFIIPAFRKIVLPYVPATVEQIENVLKAVNYRRPFEQQRQQKQPGNSDTKLIDLGSGDGRIVSLFFFSCLSILKFFFWFPSIIHLGNRMCTARIPFIWC